MSEVKVDTISERTAAGGVTIDGVLIKDGVATFQTAAGSPLVFEGATADAFETTFAITDPTADRIITFPDSSFTVPTTGGKVVGFAKYELAATQETSTSTSWVSTSLTISYTPVSSSNHLIISTNTSAASLRPTQYHTESFFRIRNTTDGVTVAEREAGLETAAGVVSNDSNPKWSQHIMGYDTGRSVATTYVLQYSVSVGSSDVAYIGRGPSDSLITVMEISA